MLHQNSLDLEAANKENRGDVIVPIESNMKSVNDYGRASRNAQPIDRPSLRNVYVVLFFTFFMRTGMAIWSRSVLTAYIFIITDKDFEAVGYITSVLGFFQLLVAFPAAHYIDNCRRETLLRLSSITGTVALTSTLTALHHQSYAWILVALAMWGLTNGLSQPAIGAIFTDSLLKEDRRIYFARRSMITSLGSVAGPIAAMLIFEEVGNKWTEKSCRTIMQIGQAFTIPSVIALWFLSDKHTAQRDTNRGSKCKSPSLIRDNLDFHREDTLGKKSFIPVFLVLSDILSAFAAGMSMRYYTIFFYDDLDLSPVLVQVIQLLMPLSMAIMVRFASAFASSLGNYRTILLMAWVGIFMKICMIFAYLRGQPNFIVCTFMILRIGFMASTQPITKFMLMNSVPRREQGKWSAFESINLFFFSGSGVIGGILVQNHGIIINFYVTASIQFVATLPIMALLNYENVQDQSLGDSTDANCSISTDDENNGKPIPLLK